MSLKGCQIGMEAVTLAPPSQPRTPGRKWIHLEINSPGMSVATWSSHYHYPLSGSLVERCPCEAIRYLFLVCTRRGGWNMKHSSQLLRQSALPHHSASGKPRWSGGCG